MQDVSGLLDGGTGHRPATASQRVAQPGADLLDHERVDIGDRLRDQRFRGGQEFGEQLHRLVRHRLVERRKELLVQGQASAPQRGVGDVAGRLGRACRRPRGRAPPCPGSAGTRPAGTSWPPPQRRPSTPSCSRTAERSAPPRRRSHLGEWSRSGIAAFGSHSMSCDLLYINTLYCQARKDSSANPRRHLISRHEPADGSHG